MQGSLSGACHGHRALVEQGAGGTAYRIVAADFRSIDMAKGQQKKTKEVRKPKKEKPKTIAAAPARGAVADIKAR